MARAAPSYVVPRQVRAGLCRVIDELLSDGMAQAHVIEGLAGVLDPRQATPTAAGQPGDGRCPRRGNERELLPDPRVPDLQAGPSDAGSHGPALRPQRGRLMTARDIHQAIEYVLATGRHVDAMCPAHEDRRPSLSVATGHDQPVLLACQAGCSTEDVLHAAGPDMGGHLHPTGAARVCGPSDQPPRRSDLRLPRRGRHAALPAAPLRAQDVRPTPSCQRRLGRRAG